MEKFATRQVKDSSCFAIPMVELLRSKSLCSAYASSYPDRTSPVRSGNKATVSCEARLQSPLG